ncbi:hypothetical protein BDV06DRAFT_224074 [Aspergillus oleicola]
MSNPINSKHAPRNFHLHDALILGSGPAGPNTQPRLAPRNNIHHARRHIATEEIKRYGSVEFVEAETVEIVQVRKYQFGENTDIEGVNVDVDVKRH